MKTVTYAYRNFNKIVRDALKLFKWYEWASITAIGWAFPFELVGILTSIAIYYFYTFSISIGRVKLEGFDPIHYIVIGLFARSLLNITLYVVYESVISMYRGFFGIGGVRMSTADYLRNFGISIYSHILADLISIYIRESIASSLYLFVGLAFYGLTLPPPDKLLLVIVVLIMGSIASLGLGFLIGSTVWFSGVLIYKSPIIWFIDILVSLASSAYFPVEMLPSWLRPFSYILPHFYCIKTIRALFNPSISEIPLDHIITLFIYMLVSISIGLVVFHIVYKRRGAAPFSLL